MSEEKPRLEVAEALEAVLRMVRGEAPSVDAMLRRPVLHDLLPSDVPGRPQPSLDAPARPVCWVRLLGRFEVWRESGRETEGGWRGKTVELLAYLAAHPQGAARERIVGALWRDDDPRQARKALRRCLSELRCHLGGAGTRERIIVGGGGRCGLNLSCVWVDAVAFEQALKRSDESDDSQFWLAQALNLYRGDFCEDSDYRWSALVVERLRGLFVQASLAFARKLMQHGLVGEGLSALDRAIERDPYNEEVCRLALLLEAERGRQDMVGRRFRRLRRLLLEDLAVEPSEETTSLFDCLSRAPSMSGREQERLFVQTGARGALLAHPLRNERRMATDGSRRA